MDISVRDVLRELRLKHGYQQNDVVKMLNDMDIETGAAQISRWENGHNNPNLLQFIGLCKIYGVKDVHKVFALRDFSDLIYELNKEGTAKLEEYKTEILRQYFINHPQSIDKYTFLQNSAFTHWVKEKCSKMC